MIIRARTVVTMDGVPIDNGAVAISGDRIIDVGKFDEIKVRSRKSIDDSPPDSSPSRARRLRCRSWRASAVAGTDQRALSSRLHLLARQNLAAKIFCRLDSGNQRGKC